MTEQRTSDQCQHEWGYDSFAGQMQGSRCLKCHIWGPLSNLPPIGAEQPTSKQRCSGKHANGYKCAYCELDAKDAEITRLQSNLDAAIATAKRREERLRAENDALVEFIKANGIPMPADETTAVRYWLCCGEKGPDHHSACVEARLGHPERCRYGTASEHSEWQLSRASGKTSDEPMLGEMYAARKRSEEQR